MIKQYTEIFNKLSSSLLQGNKSITTQQTQKVLSYWYDTDDLIMNYCWEYCPHHKSNIKDFNQWLPLPDPISKMSLTQEENTGSFLSYFSETKDKHSIISINNKIYLINTAIQGIQNVEGFILTSQNITYVLNYLELCLLSKRVISILTTPQLWNKLEFLLQTLWDETTTLFFAKNCRTFYNLQSADIQIGKVSLLFRKKFWFELSYDLIVSVNGNKYLLESQSLSDEDKIIYYAWKKDIISEEEYCQFIDVQITREIYWSSHQHQSSFQPFQLQKKEESQWHIQQNLKYFQIFSRAHIFLTVQDQIIEELYFCGKLYKANKNQILYKAGTVCYNFYVIIDGQCQTENHQQFGPSSFFGIQSLILNKKKLSSTLKSISSKTVFYCFDLSKFSNILGYHQMNLSKMPNVSQTEINKDIFWFIIQESHQKGKNLKKGKKITYKDGSQMEISPDLFLKICSRSFQFIIK